MKVLCLVLLALSAPSFASQGHDVTPAEALQKLDFMRGEWTGEQNFVTDGAPLKGSVVTRIADAIGGRYLEESISTTMPSRKPSDTRHFLTFDPKSGTYRAWWFNDSSVGAMEFEGALTGDTLVLVSKPVPTAAGSGTVFRATYEKLPSTQLGYMLEMKTGESWRRLFRTVYSRKA